MSPYTGNQENSAAPQVCQVAGSNADESIGAGELAFAIHRGRTGLAELREEWRKLEADVSLEFYQSHQWYSCLLNHLATTDEDYLFVPVFRNGRVIAIFPFECREEVKLGIRYRFLDLPLHPHMLIRDVPRARTVPDSVVLEALLGYLAKRSGVRWDGVRFHKISATSELNRLVGQRSGPLYSSEQRGSSYVIRCNKASADENMAHVSSRFRRNMRRLRKRAEGIGPVTFEACRGVQATSEGLPLFLDVEHDSWKSASGSSIASEERLVRFYEAVSRMEVSGQECQVNLLKIGGETAAAQFGIRSGRTYYMLKIGYRDSYSEIGPGNLLLSDTIEYFTRDPGIDTINLVTAPPWAEKWKSHEVPLASHFIYRNSLRGLVASGAMKLKSYMRDRREEAASRAINATGKGDAGIVANGMAGRAEAE